MDLWNELPFLMKLFLIALPISALNYWFLGKKGYTSITYFILGIGVVFTLLYQISKMF